MSIKTTSGIHAGRPNRLLGLLDRLAPHWVMAPNLGLVRRTVLNLETSEISASDLSKIKRGRQVDLLLGPGACLVKTVEAPKSAVRQIASVVDVFLRQNLPGQGKGLVWRIGALKIDGDKVRVNAHVCKDSTLRKLQADVEGRGARLRLVGLAHDAGSAPFMDHRRALNRGGRLWGWLAGLLFLGAIAAQGWTLQNRVVQAERQATELRSSRDALSTEVLAMAETVRAAETSRGSGEADILALIAGTGRTQLLERLTALIDSEFWLTEMTVRAHEIRLAGNATGDVVDLVAKLQAAPWVQRATLDGPVTRDPFEGTTRFDLVIVTREMREETSE